MAHAVLRRDHQTVAHGVVEHEDIGGRNHAGVPHRGVGTLRGQLVGGAQAGSDRLAHAEQADRSVAGPQLTRFQAASDFVGIDMSWRRLGNSDGRRSGQFERGAQHRLDFLGRGWREHRHARDGKCQRHVEDAVVARTVVAGDAGPVQHEDDRAAVQAHVQVGLVEGA